MSLRYGLRSAADLFAKLRRDSAALEAEVSSDSTFNFVVTAYHLKEWIASDPSIEVDPTKLERIARSKWFQACRDLANASKHFELDPRRNPDPAHGSPLRRRLVPASSGGVRPCIRTFAAAESCPSPNSAAPAEVGLRRGVVSHYRARK